MTIQFTVDRWDETPLVPVLRNDYAEACFTHFDTDTCFEAHMESEGLKKVQNEAGGFDWVYYEHEAPYVDFPRALRDRFEDFFDCKLYNEEEGTYTFPRADTDPEAASALKLHQFIWHCERYQLGAHTSNLKAVLEYMIANPSFGKFKVIG